MQALVASIDPAGECGPCTRMWRCLMAGVRVRPKPEALPTRRLDRHAVVVETGRKLVRGRVWVEFEDEVSGVTWNGMECVIE